MVPAQASVVTLAAAVDYNGRALLWQASRAAFVSHVFWPLHETDT